MSTGESGTSSAATVYQGPNSYTPQYGAWSVSCNANPTTISAAGGTSTLSGTATRSVRWDWSSGSQETRPNETATVTSFSIVSPVSGFSLSGLTLTATSNSSTSTRSVQVRSTYSGVNSNPVTVTQSAATESTYYEYSISISPTSASFSAYGESKSFTVTSQRRLVTVNSISGNSYGSWGSTSWETYGSLGTGFSQTTSGNTVTVTASSNSGSSRSGTLSVRCTSSTSTTASASLSQSGASTTPETVYEFTVSPTSLSFSKDGGSKTVSVVSRSRIKYTNDVDGSVSYGNWSSVSYSASSTNSAFSSTTPTGTSTNSASVSVGANSGASRSATITYTQSGSGTKKTVSCSQDMGIQDRTVRRYVFSVSPTSVNIGSSGESIVLDVTSYYETATQTNSGSGWVTGSWGGKTGVTPGTRLGSSSSPFSVSSPSAGSTGNYTISVSAGANSSTSSRTGSLSLSQARSGIQENGSSWSSPANINVPLNQEGKIESKKYWEFNISIPANTSTGSPKPWNWNLKFSNLQGQKFSISSSSAGASYTHIEKMEVDPIYYGMCNLLFEYGAGVVTTQVGFISPSSITLDSSEQVFYLSASILTPPAG